MNLKTKYAFLKTVAMPNQNTILKCLNDYVNFESPQKPEGKYGFMVIYNTEDMIDDETKLGKEPSFDQPAENDINLLMDLNKKGGPFKNDYRNLKLMLNDLAKQKLDVHYDHDDFFNIYIGSCDLVPTECRLYLRILPSKIFQVVELLTHKFVSAKIPVHFKFKPSTRLDSIVIYTSYENAQKIVDIIESIKNERLDLFKNAEKIHPLWGRINGYIGFMEEPKNIQKPTYQGKPFIVTKSANSFRTKFLDLIAEYCKTRENLPPFVTISFLRKFSECLDIDPRFIPLNASSTRALEEAKFDLNYIGSNAQNTIKTREL